MKVDETRPSIRKHRAVNIKQLKLFVSVVEQGSLSSAARANYVTVQAVSKAIKNLEHDLGGDLLARGNDGTTLTPFGKALYQAAETTVERFEELESFGTAYREQLGRPGALALALCAPPFKGSEEACASIAAFIGSHIGIETTVELGCGEAALDKLGIGELDALVSVGPLSRPDAECVTIGRIPVGAMMAADHPLAALPAVRLDGLESCPIARVPEFGLLNNLLELALAQRGAKARFVEVSSRNIEQFFAEGGVSLSLSVKPLGPLQPGTVTRPLDVPGLSSIPICLVAMKDRKTSACFALESLLTADPHLLLGGKYA